MGVRDSVPPWAPEPQRLGGQSTFDSVIRMTVTEDITGNNKYAYAFQAPPSKNDLTEPRYSMLAMVYGFWIMYDQKDFTMILPAAQVPPSMLITPLFAPSPLILTQAAPAMQAQAIQTTIFQFAEENGRPVLGGPSFKDQKKDEDTKTYIVYRKLRDWWRNRQLRPKRAFKTRPVAQGSTVASLAGAAWFALKWIIPAIVITWVVGEIACKAAGQCEAKELNRDQQNCADGTTCENVTYQFGNGEVWQYDCCTETWKKISSGPGTFTEQITWLVAAGALAIGGLAVLFWLIGREKERRPSGPRGEAREGIVRRTARGARRTVEFPGQVEREARAGWAEGAPPPELPALPARSVVAEPMGNPRRKARKVSGHVYRGW